MWKWRRCNKKKNTHWGLCKLLILCCASLERGEYDLLRTQLFRIETKLAPTKRDFLCKKKSISCYTSEGRDPQRWRKCDGGLFDKTERSCTSDVSLLWCSFTSAFQDAARIPIQSVLLLYTESNHLLIMFHAFSLDGSIGSEWICQYIFREHLYVVCLFHY